MKSHSQLLDGLRELNPVPSPTDVDTRLTSATAFLESLEERDTTMTGSKTRPEPSKVHAPAGPPQRARWLVAAAAAVVVAAIVGVGAILLADSSDDATGFADRAAAGDAPAILGAFLEQYLVGDVEGAMQYIDPGITNLLTTDQLRDEIAFVGIVYPTDQHAEIACEDSGFGDRVACTLTYGPDSALQAIGYGKWTVTAQITDGRIASYTNPVALAFEDALAQYAQAQDPAGYDNATCRAVGPANLGLNTEPCARFLQSHLDAFFANN